ncbi:MAG: hypothetical protein JSS79_13805 [Bacteroidetes bacterium]|nr:hypothetical protein [Bacteroidota bacterium]
MIGLSLLSLILTALAAIVEVIPVTKWFSDRLKIIIMLTLILFSLIVGIFGFRNSQVEKENSDKEIGKLKQEVGKAKSVALKDLGLDLIQISKLKSVADSLSILDKAIANSGHNIKESSDRTIKTLNQIYQDIKVKNDSVHKESFVFNILKTPRTEYSPVLTLVVDDIGATNESTLEDLTGAQIEVLVVRNEKLNSSKDTLNRQNLGDYFYFSGELTFKDDDFTLQGIKRLDKEMALNKENENDIIAMTYNYWSCCSPILSFSDCEPYPQWTKSNKCPTRLTLYFGALSSEILFTRGEFSTMKHLGIYARIKTRTGTLYETIRNGQIREDYEKKKLKRLIGLWAVDYKNSNGLYLAPPVFDFGEPQDDSNRFWLDFIDHLYNDLRKFPK